MIESGLNESCITNKQTNKQTGSPLKKTIYYLTHLLAAELLLSVPHAENIDASLKIWIFNQPCMKSLCY